MKQYCFTREEAQDILGAYDDAIDYVGPKGLEAIISRYIIGIDVNPAAYNHDLGYIIGGTEEDRNNIDTEFLAEMMFAIQQHKYWYGTNWFLKSLARRIAMGYYEAVLAVGAKHFCHIEDNDE